MFLIINLSDQEMVHLDFMYFYVRIELEIICIRMHIQCDIFEDLREWVLIPENYLDYPNKNTALNQEA